MYNMKIVFALILLLPLIGCSSHRPSPREVDAVPSPKEEPTHGVVCVNSDSDTNTTVIRRTNTPLWAQLMNLVVDTTESIVID